MIKKSIILLLILFFAASLYAADNPLNYAKIKFVIGDVKVKRLAGTQLDAKIGMDIYAGDKVVTGKDAAAEIALAPKVDIRVAANSEFELKKDELNQAKERETIFGLNFGKMWASIAKLKKEEKVSFETPTAVAGVRGTILVLEQGDEKVTLYLGKGAVNLFSKLLNTALDIKEDYVIDVGKDGKFSEPRLMSAQDKKNMMNGIPIYFKGKGDSKSQLNDEIQNENNNLNQNQQFAHRLQNNDLRAGRTLIDIHGNTVQVDQILHKNAPNSFEIINLSKRANSLDYLDIILTYANPLPANFKDWPGFFSDPANYYQQDATLGNKQLGSTTSVEWTGNYDPNTQKFGDNQIFVINNNGTKTKYTGDLYQSQSGNTSSDQLSSTATINLTPVGPGAANALHFQIYVIDNSGNILTSQRFQSGGDILNIFNTTAGEMVVTDDNLMLGTIDIVGVPDIALVFIQQVY